MRASHDCSGHLNAAVTCMKQKHRRLHSPDLSAAAVALCAHALDFLGGFSVVHSYMKIWGQEESSQTNICDTGLLVTCIVVETLTKNRKVATDRPIFYLHSSVANPPRKATLRTTTKRTGLLTPSIKESSSCRSRLACRHWFSSIPTDHNLRLLMQA